MVKKNLIQFHQTIKENSIIKESSGYKNKESKVKGNSLRYIFRNNYGIGFYSLKTERRQIVNNLSKAIAADASYKQEAAKDLEFINYRENQEFNALIN